MKDEKEVKEYLRKILNREAFDKKGLIYGMGLSLIHIWTLLININ